MGKLLWEAIHRASTGPIMSEEKFETEFFPNALEEIRKLVEDRAKSDDYDYVFDKSGLSTSQVPFLLYTKDATDITAGLLDQLNKDAPAATPEGAPGN